MAARGACSVDRSRHPDSCIATHAVVGGRDVGWRRSRSVQPKGFEALRWTGVKYTEQKLRENYQADLYLFWAD